MFVTTRATHTLEKGRKREERGQALLSPRANGRSHFRIVQSVMKVSLLLQDACPGAGRPTFSLFLSLPLLFLSLCFRFLEQVYFVPHRTLICEQVRGKGALLILYSMS